MFSFQNPAGFLLLLLIPVFYLLRYFKIFRQITFPAVLADWNGKKFTWNGKLRKVLSIVAKAFLVIGFILSIIAFADPVVSSQEKIYTSLGTDLIFVVDTSPSMAAKDVDGITRIQAAKNAMETLAKEHEGCRFGLVGLGSNASVLVPPTNDLTAIGKRISEISVGMLGNGSAIGDGLSTAVCHLATSSAPKKCIILLTDGENNAGEIHPETAAKLAAENEITVYVVGLGSQGTVPIEYTDPVTGKNYSGYLNSDFNSNSLKKIAGIGNGRYFEARTVDDLAYTFNFVAKNEAVTQNFTYKNKNTPYYSKFLLAAMILFISAWILKHLVLKETINFEYKKILILRSVLLSIAFVMVVLAYMGLSWGTYMAPVQKSGTAVSFVFDISNSMLAKDGPNKMTRLEAASLYAKKLMSKMEGTSVSVILAKGDGIAAIPITEDYNMIDSLLSVMSPNLMTAPGTSLGKGILCAKNTFPKNYSSAGRIWVFTDGEETDGSMSNAMVECVMQGIPVTVIGFGSESESEVLAGDGKTKIKSALRTSTITESIDEAKKKARFYKAQIPLSYLNSAEKGSALVLLNQLKGTENQIISYEQNSIPRFKFFLIIAIICFAFSFIFVEFDFGRFISKNHNKAKVIAASSIFLIFTGCSSQTTSILKGTYAWHQKNYRHAISFYLETARKAEAEQNTATLNYALYNLGTAYLALGEYEAAMEVFSKIPDDAPENVRYSAFFNSGIIAHKNENFDEAQNYFRKALEIDSSKVAAKINLELSLNMAEAEANINQSEAIPTVEEHSTIPEIENAVFNHIKENDKKQWKNSESNQSQNLAEDY